MGELESSQEMGGLEGVEGDGTGRGLSAGASEACSGLLEEGGVCWETNRGGGAGLRNGARRGAGEEASGVWLGQREDQGIANGDSLTVSRGSVERPGRNELSQQFLEEGENAEPDCEQQGESCRGGGAIGGGSVDGCDREKPCTESDERACTIVSPAEGKESVHTECTIASARNEQMSPPVSVAAPDEPGRLQADCSTRELELGDSEDSENGGDRVEESRLLQRGPSDSAFGQGDGFDFVTLVRMPNPKQIALAFRERLAGSEWTIAYVSSVLPALTKDQGPSEWG